MANKSFRKAVALKEVIVIIAIFVLMVMACKPVVDNVKEQSKEQICQNNLKQLIPALYQYCQDNDDLLPLTITSDKKWMDFLDPYTGTNREQRMKYDTSTPYHCPVALELHTNNFAKNNGNTYGANGCAYGRQVYIAEAEEWTDFDVVPQYKLGDLSSPELCSAFGDGHWNAEANDPRSGYTPGSWTVMIDAFQWSTPERIHNGGANFIFFDGHVEMVSDIPTKNGNPFWKPTRNK